MKGIYLLFGIIVFSGVMLTIFSCAAREPKTGLVNGRLRPCPDTPNCVSSETQKTSAQVKFLTFDDAPEAAWQRLKKILPDMGGKIIKDENGYLRATFTSTVFRFVDDMEFRMAVAGKRIHLRSGSRVGHSDFGVNRKRVETLRTRFSKNLMIE